MRPRALPFVALLVLASAARADTAPQVRRVLFLGNSFTYVNDGVPLHLRKLAAAAEKTDESAYDYTMATRPGALLAELEPLSPQIAARKWDVVVLQGQSQEPIAAKPSADGFRAATRAFDGKIRATGARTALYMTWAYRDDPSMTEPLAQAYRAAGKELGAIVVPVGLAFARVRRTEASIDLYAADGRHPSLAGTYLAACVFYAALFRKSPEGNDYVAGLRVATARKLQKAAWETVNDSQ